MEPPPIPRPHLQNPIAGTTIDTSPSQLGLTSDRLSNSVSSAGSSPSEDGKNLLSRTVDKLSRSRSLNTTKQKIMSLNKKGRDRTLGVKTRRDLAGAPERMTSPEMSEPHLPESPLPPSRASLGGLGGRFQGDGSMRMGTQTLIQALQAIPWEEDRAEDEMGSRPHQLGGAISSDDEGDDRHGPMASSIHTIHRHLARSRRGTPVTARPSKGVGLNGSYFASATSEEEDMGNISEEMNEEEDFEPSTSPPVSTSMHFSKPQLILQQSRLLGAAPHLTAFARQGSMATVRIKRRARLADKLKEVFGLKEIEEVVAEMPCWLLRSVLLQGYMYLTNAHLCFFAHMPSREDQILKSGTLSKKAQRTKRWTKYWYVLKNDVLSWYQSSADPYFPQGNVDLRYAISCEPMEDKSFKLRTNQKTLHMAADSVPSRDEWVKAIRKVIFKAQNHGESVKISIPYSAILDVEKSTAMDFSETIEVKVVDKDENFAMDSYFFAYFRDLPGALEQIRDCIIAYRHNPLINASTTVKDTTHRPTMLNSPPSQAASLPPTSVTSRFAFSNLFRGGPFSTIETANPLSRSTSAPDPSHGQLGEFTHVPSHSPSQPIPVKRPAEGGTTSSHVSARPDSVQTSVPSEPQDMSASSEHTYPPGTSPDISTFHHVGPQDTLVEESSSLAAFMRWPVPGWLRMPSKRFFSSPGTPNAYENSGEVSEVYENINPDRPSLSVGATVSSSGQLEGDGTGSAVEAENQLGFSILEAPADHSQGLDPAIVEKFRLYFALDEKEQLLGYVPGYLYRLLPLFGRFYISTNYFCFRSSQPLRKTTMMIPIRDIIATQKSRAFRFGHHGLIVVIKGHEELFFEFSTADRRATCSTLLAKQIDELHKRQPGGEVMSPSQSKRDALILEELDPSGYMGESLEGPRPPPETDTLPAVMFTSTNSTFLAFKPQESMHITCLTIGSRGDCQPYIALCKRLKADGHRCRIATHLEYKDWVEGHGIEFVEVGGDPAELMRICVENGMFTYGFLKETLQKFRGWLDDLLVTSYQACQGTDLLIESPSAMGGIHIAEALRIPYFRAFTMPWSRTRAYPHAFAVPERKMGGGYNYMSYLMFDQVFWRAISGQINRWRRNVLGIGPTNFDKLEQHRVPFLYNFSPSVVPPPLDWSEWIKVTGYWFLDDPDDSATKKWTPPPDLVSFIDSAHTLGKKVVYIGFGSIVVSDPEAMTKAVVEAIVASGVYAILSKGWSDRLSTKKASHTTDTPEVPLPPQIYPISSIPHDWLFPRIDAACHHGGAGTTGASLRAGIPTIIKPFFGDQFFWADRVEALDVGSSVRKLTVESLTEALLTATTDVKQIERAKLLGQQIRAENGVDKAVEAIYRDLDYARSLIKQPSTPDHTPVDQREPPTPDRSMEGSTESNRGGISDWSVISEDGEETALDRPRQRGSPSPISSPTSKRTSLTAVACATLQDVLGRPSLNKRRSSDGRTQLQGQLPLPLHTPK